MNNKLEKIFQESLNEKLFCYIKNEYSEVRELSLFELGIDSLEYIRLLVSLEENIGISIDDIGEISSIKMIEEVLEHGTSDSTSA